MTLKEYRDIAIIKTHIEGHKLFPEARLNFIVNKALKFVQVQLNGLGYKKWEKSIVYTGITLIADTLGSVSVKKASIPIDMLESNSSLIMIDTTDGTLKGTSKQEFSPTQFESTCSSAFSAPMVREAGYTRLANFIYFYPPTITRVICYYFSVLADLSNDTDTSLVPVEFEDSVIQKAVNDIRVDLGEIKDSEAADKEVSDALTNAYQKVAGAIAGRGDEIVKKESGVVE
jgi:hypothetical protein